MAQFTQWLIGVFPDRVSADETIHDLKRAGFDATQIGLAVWTQQENAGTHEQGAATAGAVADSQAAPAPGAGALVVPNAGSYIASGALASTLTGDSAGHITSALLAMGVPQDAANAYQRRLEQGAAIVVVDTQGRNDQAQAIFFAHGAQDAQAGQPETDRVGGGVGVSGETLPAGGGYRGSGAPINDTPDTTAYAPRPDAATPTETPNNPQLPPEMQQWSDLGDPSLDPADTPASTLSSTPASTPASPLNVDSARQPVVGAADAGRGEPPPDHPRTDEQILADAGQPGTEGGQLTPGA